MRGNWERIESFQRLWVSVGCTLEEATGKELKEGVRARRAARADTREATGKELKDTVGNWHELAILIEATGKELKVSRLSTMPSMACRGGNWERIESREVIS